MGPRDFLEVADEWVTGTREAEWRSGVSRAYYAAFHVPRDLLRQCGFAVPQAEQAHSYLWLRLSNTGRLDVDAAGSDLKDLRRFRNWADYDLDYPFPQRDAIAQVIDAIRVYERDVLREVIWQAPGPTP